MSAPSRRLYTVIVVTIIAATLIVVVAIVVIGCIIVVTHRFPCPIHVLLRFKIFDNRKRCVCVSASFRCVMCEP